ncbi:hypothetical protein N3K66_001404 [Trichothecium roseum]|uniref:Uncharacterized protein n=1 Tax=Trichothecium roseum TaxID=47278 RepID=A0ACC0VGB2_9HYPO|nr:hypothetical protein N3K66_001404 [Trichothecium roseum]
MAPAIPLPRAIEQHSDIQVIGVIVVGSLVGLALLAAVLHALYRRHQRKRQQGQQGQQGQHRNPKHLYQPAPTPARRERRLLPSAVEKHLLLHARSDSSLSASEVRQLEQEEQQRQFIIRKSLASRVSFQATEEGREEEGREEEEEEREEQQRRDSPSAEEVPEDLEEDREWEQASQERRGGGGGGESSGGDDGDASRPRSIVDDWKEFEANLYAERSLSVENHPGLRPSPRRQCSLEMHPALRSMAVQVSSPLVTPPRARTTSPLPPPPPPPPSSQQKQQHQKQKQQLQQQQKQQQQQQQQDKKKNKVMMMLTPPSRHRKTSSASSTSSSTSSPSPNSRFDDASTPNGVRCERAPPRRSIFSAPRQPAYRSLAMSDMQSKI